MSIQTGLGLELSEAAASRLPRQWNVNASRAKWRLRAKFRSDYFRQCLPALDGVNLAGARRIAFGVGGDYYDAFEIGDGLGLAIGDVSGKGISAALGWRVCAPASAL